MAVKRKYQKKLESKQSWERAVKIKCYYCDAKETCKFRAHKEKDEDRGIITYCTISPNCDRKKKVAGPKNFFEAMFASEDVKKEYMKNRKANKKYAANSKNTKNKRKQGE